MSPVSPWIMDINMMTVLYRDQSLYCRKQWLKYKIISISQVKELNIFSISALVARALFVCRMFPRYLICVILLCVFLSPPTTWGYIIIYPSMPLRTTNPWMGSFLPVRTVINFSDEDCSGGDGLYPVPDSGCWQYYVCSAGRVSLVVFLRLVIAAIPPTTHHLVNIVTSIGLLCPYV